MPIIKSKDVAEVDKITKDLKKIRDEIDALTKSADALVESLQSVKKSSDGKEAKELAEKTRLLKEETLKLIQAQKVEQETIKKQILDNQKLQKAEQERIKTEQAQLRLLAQQKREADKLIKSEEKLTRETEKQNSAYQKLSAQLNDARKKYKDLAVQNKQNTKEGRALLANITKLDSKLKAVDKSVGQNQRSVGKYTDALKGLGRQLIGALGITAGVTLLVNQFKRAAERIGILNKLTRELKGTFDITTKEAKKLAAQINAMAVNIEGVDTKNLQTSLTVIAKTFDDLSEQEVLDLIQEGFAKGSNNSGEFLDILKEYPIFFKKAGLSASEMFAIINQQVKEGVYSDKGVDAIKEATISLTENTKIVKDALRPLGESVNLQIRQKVEAGKAFEAMQLISQEMVNLGVNSAEAQTIMADVFKGAGEDSDAFVRNLHNVNLSLDDVAKQTSINSEANLKLSESYNKFLLSVSDGNGIFSKSIASFKTWVSEILDGFRIINDADVVTKFKQISNGVLAFVGVGEKYRFEINEQTEVLKLNNLETDFAIRKAKEQKEALAEETKAVIELTKAQKKRLAEQQKINAAYLARKDDIVELLDNEVEAVKNVGEVRIETEIETQERLTEIAEEFGQTRHNLELENAKTRAQEIADAELLIREQLETSIVQLASDIFNSFQDQKIARLETDANSEKEILQNKLDKGVISQEEFTSKIAAIDKKFRLESAKAERNKALFDIALATSIAIISALASVPPNIPLSIAVGVVGGIQAAAVSARPLDFAEGGEVHGPGTSKSDSIPANLSNGEFIVNSKGYSDAHDIINAVNDGILTDRNAGSMLSKQDNNMMLAGLLMQGNKNSNQLITLMANMGYTVTRGGQTTHYRADGGSPDTFLP